VRNCKAHHTALALARAATTNVLLRSHQMDGEEGAMR